ncbi:hypothetical protein ABZ590_38245, partial [Streptomyces hirsutus]
MTHQTIDEHDEVLTSEDLALLRANLREQQLFRRDQLRQFAVDEGPHPGATARRNGRFSQTTLCPSKINRGPPKPFRSSV